MIVFLRSAHPGRTGSMYLAIFVKDVKNQITYYDLISVYKHLVNDKILWLFKLLFSIGFCFFACHGKAVSKLDRSDELK